jgi:lipopolysaccharide/colanic/teichoic acid biosynthesis glycosyltransferase
MRIWPVFLDSVPSYLGRSGGSLLLTPTGSGLLVSRLRRMVETVTTNVPVVVSLNAGIAYREAMQAASADLKVLSEGEDLIETLPTMETSDAWLFVDARYYIADPSRIKALVDQFSSGRQIAHHLVAFETSVAGTKEHVNVDAAGRVRSIHRYYEATTWPFVAGVAASLVPASSGLLYLRQVPASLIDLRQHLATHGVPSRDVAVEGGAVDLTSRHGLLAAMEHDVCTAANQALAAGPVLVGDGHDIAPTARILGPVVLHPGVSIGAGATIVGPSLIGAGAHISGGAIVASTLVGPEARVPRDRTLRDRVWFNDLDDWDHDAPDTLYNARLDRLSFEPETVSAVAAAPAGSHPWYLPWKRAFDVVSSLMGLVLLSPFFLLIAVLIRLEGRGATFYRSEREGVGGRRFRCFKFRTMKEGAHGLQHLLKAQDKLDGPHFKLDEDPRVTALGRFLRATNLDELPQLFNVLRGDMSLVGPRPSPFRENQICVPWREGRLSLRPGVTGLWQVCRHDRALGDFHQWIEYDLLYVQQASPWLDLKILLATVVTLLMRRPIPASWLVRLPAAPVVVAGREQSATAEPLPAQPPAVAASPAEASSRTA